MTRILTSLNTVFGRLAVLTVALLILLQVTVFTFVEYDHGLIESINISRLARFASDASNAGKLREEAVENTFGLRYVNVSDTQALSLCPNNCEDRKPDGLFGRSVSAHLPVGTHVVFAPGDSVVWVRYADAARWLVIPANLPTLREVGSANMTMLVLALTIALVCAWQIQRPILRLARAARMYRTRSPISPVRVEGPSEVKALIHDFNNMVTDLSDAEQERDVMLAGVAHDLRAPLTRIQLRAALVPEGPLRQGFLHDSQSLSQIVTQFLDFARDLGEEDLQTRVSVDDFCRNQYGEENEGDESIIQIDLKAGPGFTLPAIHLDRILSNIIENAFSYGQPPILIFTTRKDDQFQLVVTDHGEGMQEENFERALRPFVRMDPARGGDAHCGLGLTIIRRLTRRNGGELFLSNAPHAGLRITLSFPAATGSADIRKPAMHA